METSGCAVEDIFALDIIKEDLYNFFERQLKLPSDKEIKSFLGGMSIVVALTPWVDLTKVTKGEALYISRSSVQGLVDCKFWFGSQYKA
jgi:hypothetical protein